MSCNRFDIDCRCEEPETIPEVPFDQLKVGYRYEVDSYLKPNPVQGEILEIREVECDLLTKEGILTVSSDDVFYELIYQPKEMKVAA